MVKKEEENNKKIILTIPPGLMSHLEKEKRLFSYNSVQEIILESLRDKYYRKKPAKEERRGRPKKLNEINMLSGEEKVFTLNKNDTPPII